jgi:CBS domain-containing protein
MVTPVVTVDENAELEDIATIMSEGKKHLIPVVRGDKVVGIIGKADMVRAIVKSE